MVDTSVTLRSICLAGWLAFLILFSKYVVGVWRFDFVAIFPVAC
jgi:hypothetical protein